jgi:hypothetical protein
MDQEPSDMELEGIEMQGIVDLVRGKDMKSITPENIQCVNPTLNKIRRDPFGPPSSPRPNMPLNTQINKLKPNKNPNDDKRRGNILNLKLLQEIGDILVNSGKDTLIIESFQSSPIFQ